MNAVTPPLTELLRNDVAAAFSPGRFAVPRLPVHVAHLPRGVLGREYPCCLDMLVKLPGKTLRLPEPYASDPGIQAFFDACLTFQDTVLAGWRDTRCAYLTVDRRFVAEGSSHRNFGWHFDGMQGERYHPKLEACHQYVVADRLTTEFTAEPTDASSLDERRHNWFAALGAQVPEHAPIHRPSPLEIVAMSAYQLHRSPVAKTGESGWRTFLRLDVTLKQFDRLGNTLNPVLPAPFAFVPRDPPPGLSTSVKDSGWEGAIVFGGATPRT